LKGGAGKNKTRRKLTAGKYNFMAGYQRQNSVLNIDLEV